MCCCCSVVSDSLQSHGLQHTSLPCPLLPPGVCSNSCPLSQWLHPTISSSAVPFFCLQSFPASGSFPVSWLFKSGGQSIGASASASVLPVNIHGWFPLRLTGWISLLFKGSQESSLAPQFKSINSLALSLLYGPALTSIHLTFPHVMSIKLLKYHIYIHICVYIYVCVYIYINIFSKYSDVYYINSTSQFKLATF